MTFLVTRMSILFAIFSSCFEVSTKPYFHGQKLISNQYLAKFLDTSVKSFFPCGSEFWNIARFISHYARCHSLQHSLTYFCSINK